MHVAAGEVRGTQRQRQTPDMRLLALGLAGAVIVLLVGGGHN